MSVLIAGLIAGALHVLSGPDHLLALAPYSLRNDEKKVSVGLKWGLGHGVGILLMCVSILGVKTHLNALEVAAAAEFLVGFVLIGVGIQTLRLARKIVIHEHEHEHAAHSRVGNHTHSHYHVHIGEVIHPHSTAQRTHSHAPLAIGLLHGVAGTSHLLLLVPALGLSLGHSALYLSAYVTASIATMILCISSIDFVLLRVGTKYLPRIVMATGLATVTTGVAWLFIYGKEGVNLIGT